jgi:hypothetical protein
MVLRLTPKRDKKPCQTEMLPGRVEPEDIPGEARALLTDPRDSIVAVFVYSEREEQFITTYKGDNG